LYYGGYKLTDKKSGRPNKSEKWTHNTPLDIYLMQGDEIEYTRTDSNGYPKFTHSTEEYRGKKCTVILGKKEVTQGYNQRLVLVLPNDVVWTSEINYRGNLTSLGSDYNNRDITVIIHK
jgi:hypothetical protein